MNISFTVEEFYRLLMSGSITKDGHEELEEFEFEAKSLSHMESIALAMRNARFDCNSDDRKAETWEDAERFEVEDAELLFSAYRLAIGAEVTYNG